MIERKYICICNTISYQAKDLYNKGHPKDREGLSLIEFMHGHGVNLRHIGLLRRYFIHEVVNNMCDGSSGGDCSEWIEGIESGEGRESENKDNKEKKEEKEEGGNIEGNENYVERMLGKGSEMESGFTPSLDDIQSELLMEALCRTLKVSTSYFLFSAFYL